jgi:transposase
MGGAEGGGLVDPGAAAMQPKGGLARGGGGFQKKLADAIAEEAVRHPERPVEAFATDEHRIGLKPVTRRVWAPIGERPSAEGHHRFEWLDVTAFVAPRSGETFWSVHDGVSKRFFEALLELFAKEAGAGRDRTIVLELDNAGWHGEAGLAVPEGIRLVYMPAYSPELQPAETLWTLVDEPIVNRHVASIEELGDIIARRCIGLAGLPDQIRSHTGFHWWPNAYRPK